MLYYTGWVVYFIVLFQFVKIDAIHPLLGTMQSHNQLHCSFVLHSSSIQIVKTILKNKHSVGPFCEFIFKINTISIPLKKKHIKL